MPNHCFKSEPGCVMRSHEPNRTHRDMDSNSSHLFAAAPTVWLCDASVMTVRCLVTWLGRLNESIWILAKLTQFPLSKSQRTSLIMSRRRVWEILWCLLMQVEEMNCVAITQEASLKWMGKPAVRPVMVHVENYASVEANKWPQKVNSLWLLSWIKICLVNTAAIDVIMRIFD